MTALGFGSEVSKVAVWAAGVACGVPGGTVVIHLGRDRGAKETGLRREVVARALEHMRAAGLIHRVRPSRGGRRAHGWMLGDLAAAEPVLEPKYARRLARSAPRVADDRYRWHPVRESARESATESATESAQGVGNGVGNGVGADSLSPLGGPEVTKSTTEVEPAAHLRGTPHHPPAAGRQASVTAAPTPRVTKDAGGVSVGDVLAGALPDESLSAIRATLERVPASRRPRR